MIHPQCDCFYDGWGVRGLGSCNCGWGFTPACCSADGLALLRWVLWSLRSSRFRPDWSNWSRKGSPQGDPPLPKKSPIPSSDVSSHLDPPVASWVANSSVQNVSCRSGPQADALLTKSAFLTELSQRLRALRKARGYAQGVVAEAVGLSTPRISNLERDPFGWRYIGAYELAILCEVLGVTVDEFLPKMQPEPNLETRKGARKARGLTVGQMRKLLQGLPARMRFVFRGPSAHGKSIAGMEVLPYQPTGRHICKAGEGTGATENVVVLNQCSPPDAPSKSTAIEKEGTRLIAMVREGPPEGSACWTLDLVREEALKRKIFTGEVSTSTIGNRLQRHGVKPWLLRSLVVEK